MVQELDYGNLHAVKETLEALRLEEAQVDEELKAFLEVPVFPDLTSVRQSLESLGGNVDVLWNTVTKAAALADGISAKVRQLDLEQTRIKEALKQVEDAFMLRSCVEDVQKCMRDGKYEQAADMIHKYLAFDAATRQILVDQSILTFDDEGKIGLKEANDVIQKARYDLLEISSREFDRAMKANDETKAISYLKLFHLIDHTEKGLDKFLSFLVQEIRRKNEIPLNVGERGGNYEFHVLDVGMTFVDTLTKLFEHIAALIDGQKKRITDLFGPGTMLYVIRGLETESILQGVKILDTLNEKRNYSRILRDVQTTSPDTKSDERLDIKELSQNLDELAFISQKAQIFNRFMVIRAQAELREVLANERVSHLYENETENRKYSASTGLLKSSEISTRIREFLSLYYLQFESYFLSQSVRKALRIDTYRVDSEDLISSCVEDVFYILKKAVVRALESQDIDTICVVLNLVSRIIEEDYLRDGLHKRLLSGFGGEKASSLSERPDAKIGYMVFYCLYALIQILLNNLDQSSNYVMKLCQEVEAQIGRLFSTPSFGDSQSNEKIKSCLSPVQESVDAFKRILKGGMDALFNQTLRMRYRSLVSETLSLFIFNMTEEDFTEWDAMGTGYLTSDSIVGISFGSSAKDDFTRKFVVTFRKLMSDGYQDYLTESNYSLLLGNCVDVLSKELELLLLNSSQRISIYAAMKFDKDLRNLTTFLNSLLPMGSFRDKLIRLSNISSLVNLESVDEYQEFDLSTWRLSTQEIRKALALRFGNEDVSRIKI